MKHFDVYCILIQIYKSCVRLKLTHKIILNIFIKIILLIDSTHNETIFKKLTIYITTQSKTKKNQTYEISIPFPYIINIKFHPISIQTIKHHGTSSPLRQSAFRFRIFELRFKSCFTTQLIG